MAPDFNFTFDGFCYTLLPNNGQAASIWNRIDATFPQCVIPLHAWASLKFQLKQAGYTIRKATKRATVNDDALLAQLLA